MDFRALALLLLLAAASGRAEEAASPPEEEAILVLQVHLGGKLLADDLVAFDPPGGVLLPLHRLAELLELPLEAGPQEGRAADGDVFVDARLLSSRLPVDVSIDRGAMVLEVAPREKLPLQERWEREARRRDLPALRPDDRASPRPRFAVEPHPYELAGWPTVDGTIGVSLGSGGSAVRHSFLARGDLLAATASLFVAGDEARLTLERQDPGGHLLGALGATEWRIGDLSVPTDPLVSTGRPGRGFLIARSPEAALAGHSDRRVLTGDALPGWEVELSRDGTLLDVQRAGDDGRYEFRDIPLRKGWNHFHLAFYGPRGERSEREERIFSSMELLPAGATSWQLGLIETGAGILRPGSLAAPGDETLSGSLLGSFDLERGLSRFLSWGAGLAHRTLQDGRHDHVRWSLRAALPGGSGQLLLTRDLRGGWAGQLRAQGDLGAVQYDVDQVVLRELQSDGEEGPDVRSRTRVRLFTRAPLPRTLFHGAALPLTLTATRRVTDRDEILTLQMASILSLSVGSSVLGSQWRLDLNDGAVSAGGNLLLNGQLRRFGLRGNLSWQLAPEPVLSDLSLQAETGERRGLAGRFGLSQSLQRSLVSASAGVTWKRSPYLLGLTLGLTSQGRAELGGSLSFSLGRDPQDGRIRVRGDAGASQGTVSARVFLDADGDGRFGPGDSPLSGVGIEANGSALPARTGDGGLAWVRVPPHRPVDLSVAEKTLADPAWVPGRSGIALVPRPGVSWAVDFPVVVTGEIDGTVFLQQGERRREVSNVRVQLADTSGAVVQEVRSQFDGFYLFERVPPGRYSIRVEPLQLERLRLRPKPEGEKPEVELRGGEIRRGVEVVLLPSPDERDLVPDLGV